MLMHIDPNYVGCRELKQFLYDYSERELDERLLMAFDNHLLACEKCQDMVYGYQKSNETVKRHLAREIKLPADLKELLVRELTAHGP